MAGLLPMQNRGQPANGGPGGRGHERRGRRISPMRTARGWGPLYALREALGTARIRRHRTAYRRAQSGDLLVSVLGPHETVSASLPARSGSGLLDRWTGP